MKQPTVGLACAIAAVSSLLLSACLHSPEAAGRPQLAFLGNPYRAGYPEGEAVYARNIWDMQLHNGTIYLGAGNSSNTGPAPNSGRVAVYSLLPGENRFRKEFIAAEEQVDSFRVLDGVLHIPGHDATQTWEYGNIYYLDQAGDRWIKLRTLPQALHVYDALMHDGLLYAAGSVPEHGAVFRSEDGGQSWSVWELGAGRVYTLFSLGQTVYAAKDFRTGAKAADALYSVDPEHGILPVADSGASAVFPDTDFDGGRAKLIRSVQAGDALYYIGAYVHNDHQNRPFGVYRATHRESAFHYERLNLEPDFVPRDILVRKGSILVLADRATSSGFVIKVFSLDASARSGFSAILEFSHAGFARSFEESGGSFYFGMGSEIADPENWSQTELAEHTGDILRYK